jgi:non-ribosomal peptide synthase protein (TIGR01720 family)
VGWLTTIHPVALEPGPDGDPAAALVRVKQQLRAVPDRGLGYGVLRYLDAESSGLLRPLPAATVSFNYLGRLDAGASGPFRLAPEPSGPARSPRAAREHALGVAAWVAEDRLHLDLSYHPAVLTPAAAAALAADLLAALRQLLALARQPQAVAPIASDFPLADLGHGELDALLGEVGFEGMGSG